MWSAQEKNVKFDNFMRKASWFAKVTISVADGEWASVTQGSALERNNKDYVCEIKCQKTAKQFFCSLAGDTSWLEQKNFQAETKMLCAPDTSVTKVFASTHFLVLFRSFEEVALLKVAKSDQIIATEIKAPEGGVYEKHVYTSSRVKIN